jgi:DNA-binding IclR family transcriptional regulator
MTEPAIPPASAVEKGIELFLAVLSSPGAQSLSGLAKQAGLPASTAHRLIGAYVRAGLLVQVGRGRYAPGNRLAPRDERAALIETSRPLLHDFALTHNVVAHLGVFEGDMVTYLVKARGETTDIWTSETNQLEGYSSAIGKVLLAHLDPPSRAAYLATGPFVAFTPHTITDPAALAATLQTVRAQGFATDNAEVDDNLFCLAVPVPRRKEPVKYAISVSSRSRQLMALTLLPALQACAARIGASLPG